MTDRASPPGVIDARLPGHELRAVYAAAFRRALEERWAERLFEHDTSLWSSDPGTQERIAERLGWLTAPTDFAERAGTIEAFGEEVRDNGFAAAVVGGMGGSSLAPWVLARVLGPNEGWLDVRVLDQTDPAAVAATVDDLDPLATLFLVATKSGTTTESLAFAADAWERARRALQGRSHPRGTGPGDFIVAITDPDKSLEAIPHHDDLVEVFLNPPDIGGRYSALTYVGLVPASLAGIELDALLARAVHMLAECRNDDPEENPGLALGLLLGTLARAGHDKLTFVIDPELAPLGAWVEQLVAESTGKLGRGIVPIVDEPLGRVEAYGPDRAFVRVVLKGSAGPGGSSADVLLEELARLGNPVVRITVGDPIDIGAEFVRWEVATAIAGIVLEVNPFDEPNVQESKDNTRRVLYALSEVSPNLDARPTASGEGITFHADSTLAAMVAVAAGPPTLDLVLRQHLRRIGPRDYLALTAFIAQSDARDAVLARIRSRLRDATKRATTVGYGPRYLHSTGQLHKGGAPIGWFIQVTSAHPVDRPIPGQPHTFGHLVDAQAMGDFQALEGHGLPVLRVHLNADVDAGLASFERVLTRVLREV